MNKEELLYNEIYERTKDFGRNQFVREIMRLQRENKQLKDKVNQLETNRDEVIEFIKNKTGVNNKNEHFRQECIIALTPILEILERGKE